jgi:hypothetical protein
MVMNVWIFSFILGSQGASRIMGQIRILTIQVSRVEFPQGR